MLKMIAIFMLVIGTAYAAEPLNADNKLGGDITTKEKPAKPHRDQQTPIPNPDEELHFNDQSGTGGGINLPQIVPLGAVPGGDMTNLKILQGH